MALNRNDFKNYLASLLIILYPVVFSYSRYADSVSYEVAVFAAIVSIIIWFVLLIFHSLLRILFLRKKAVLDPLLLILASFVFVIYGHIYYFCFNKIIMFQVEGGDANPNNAFAGWSLHAVLLLFIFLLIYQAHKKLCHLPSQSRRSLSGIILIFATALITIPGSNILWKVEAKKESSPDTREYIKAGIACKYCDSDVYLIVLDGYARADILEKFYGYSNADFLSVLADYGFTTVDNARSNYSWTFLSLSSMLNMDLVQNLPVGLDPDKKETAPFNNLIRNSAVSNFFQNHGYKFLHMRSTWGPTLVNPFADYQYNCNSGFSQNDFYRVLVEGSILTLFNSRMGYDLAQCHLDNFSWLENVPRQHKERKFVFSHIIMPHHPYLFDENGKILRDANLSDQFEFQKRLWSDRDGYLSQLKFLNKQVVEIVETLSRESDNPPFIVIMSDHGPQLLDSSGKRVPEFDYGRSSILLSVLTPDKNKELPVKSSVNLFKYLFNQYWGGENSFLEDSYYKSPYNKPFAFEKVEFSK